MPLTLADLVASRAPSAPKMWPTNAKETLRHHAVVGAKVSAPSAKNANTSRSAMGRSGAPLK
eukprot:41021-Amphidinium_carterae.1